jgi:hypothetical protein
MVNRDIDYSADAVEAARMVMLEVTRALGEYADSIVIVGGWVPELLLAASGAKHIGSNDVDLALNHRKLTDAGYRTICAHLVKRGYTRHFDQPFVFLRPVTVNGREITVHVDLLSGEYGGTSRNRRHQRVQDVMPRKARGCDLAFENVQEVKLEGSLPGGGKDSVTVRVAGIVPFIIMKGMALADRMKEKDAWDIHFCLTHFPGGLDALAESFRPHLGNGLVKEGLAKIKEKFASPHHVGPKWVADFDELTDEEARAIRQRDAFERMNALLARLSTGGAKGRHDND